MTNPIMGARDGLTELSKLTLSRGWHFNRPSFAAVFALLNLTAGIPETRYITMANCVTPNDDENTRIGKESRCNCLFLGRPIRRRRPVEEAVTSELFSGEDDEKERTGEGDEDGRETCETVILAIRQVIS